MTTRGQQVMSTLRTRLATASIGIVAILAAAEMAASESPRPSPHAVSGISMMAGECQCFGAWSLRISGGELDAEVMGAPQALRTLTAAEERELAALVAALPTAEPVYEIGTSYSDLPRFEVAVESGDEVRRYSVAAILAGDAEWPDAAPVIGLMRFLRALVATDEALTPPTLDDDDPAEDTATEVSTAAVRAASAGGVARP